MGDTTTDTAPDPAVLAGMTGELDGRYPVLGGGVQTGYLLE